MKAGMKNSMAGGLIITALMMLASCQKDMKGTDDYQYASVIQVASDGTTTFIDNNLKMLLTGNTALADTLASSLVKIREEEKLARDVYAELGQRWNNLVFQRISTAESNHLTAVITLMKSAGLADTVVEAEGVFVDSGVQALYNNLVAQGSASLPEAYQTGALIEEMDIYDLSQVLLNIVDANTTLVLDNLMRGSRNHLRAFNRQLSALGISYTPVYISQDEFDQVVNSPMEQGQRYRFRGRKGNQGNCQGNMPGYGNWVGN